jgi:cephalosporin hydroxylase
MAEEYLTSSIKTECDIDKHLIYLLKLASECESILECGVRSVVSSWAFLNGLLINKSNKKLLHSCDIERSHNIIPLENIASIENVEFKFHECNDLDLEMIEYDMIFIDTWHIYGHLKRELKKFSLYAKKYIVMHDTVVDAFDGESIRCGFNIAKQVKDSGYPEEEIRSGLQKAIAEFLTNNPEWRVKIHFTHQNGLTVLERI